ncbi:MAG: TRAP transporter small permease subunit [Pikeienuella sp.]
MLWPAGFVAAMMWVVWNMPGYILLLGGGSERLAAKYQPAGALDLLLLAVALICLCLGVARATPDEGEIPAHNVMDRFAIFIGRVTMALLLILAAVIPWEITMRYAFAAPTLWVNEFSLWITGFIFFLSGVVAQRQRNHIRIDFVHAHMPRPMKKAADIVSAGAACLFAFGILWGSYNEITKKFFNWETFGTAFDPPIPATLMPLMVLALLTVAIQGVVNLIMDWKTS